MMGTMFDYAFRRFATAFEERADTIYGTEGPGRPKEKREPVCARIYALKCWNRSR